jgi:hypothetical protein
MSNDDEEYAKSAAHHAIATGSLNRVQSYVERGRKYAKIPIKGLEAAFVKAYRDWAADEKNAAARLMSDDTSAEYTLRGVEEPFDLIKPEIEVVAQRAKRMFDNLSDDRQTEMNAEIVAEYEEARRRGN